MKILEVKSYQNMYGGGHEHKLVVELEQDETPESVKKQLDDERDFWDNPYRIEKVDGNRVYFTMVSDPLD